MRKLFILGFILIVSQLRAQWTPAKGITTGKILSFAEYADSAGQKKIFCGTADKGLFISSDNGENWTSIPGSSMAGSITGLISLKNKMLMGSSKGMVITADEGKSWTAARKGLTDSSITSLFSAGNNIYAGTLTGKVFLSTDEGANWTVLKNGLPGSSINTLNVKGTNLFAGTYGKGIYSSNNSGGTWVKCISGINDAFVTSMAVNGTDIYAGTSEGSFRSSDNGKSWVNISGELNTLTETFDVYSLAVYGAGLFAGTSGRGVFMTTNNGANWTNIKSGSGSSLVYSLYVYEGNLFAAADSGLWKRPLSQIITSVEKLTAKLPVSFSLHQNYPNPFNPSTTIKFSLPAASSVSIYIYDAVGRIAAELISENLPAGTFSAEWNASGFTSGVYYCLMKAGDFSFSRKLILLK